MKDTVKVANKGATLMVAHRGASGLEQENTVPSFVAAGNRSYFGEECDVHVTKDGKYLIYHDDETSRLCSKAMHIEESLFDELRALKIKEFRAETFSETLKIPTLQEYLTIVSSYGKAAVIELKAPMQEGDIRNVIEICKEIYSLEKVIFISFFFQNLLTVRKLLPEQTVQFLTDTYSEDLKEKLIAHKFDLDIGFWTLNEEIVHDLHAHGIKVNCWTCDDPDKAKELISWGVDFITTNILE